MSDVSFEFGFSNCPLPLLLLLPLLPLLAHIEMEETEETKSKLVEQVRKQRKRKREEKTKKEMAQIATWEEKAIQKAKDKAEAEIRSIKREYGRKRAKLEWQNYGDVDDPDNTLCLHTCEELRRMLD